LLSLAVYKTIHYLGIFTLVTALTAALARAATAGLSTQAGASAETLADPWKKRLGIAHGVGLFLVLLGGFGMLARLGLGLTGWVNVKLAIWLLVGGLIALRKSPAAASWGVALVPLLAALAAYVAYTKPF
jgi:hypothetical protein